MILKITANHSGNLNYDKHQGAGKLKFSQGKRSNYWNYWLPIYFYRDMNYSFVYNQPWEKIIVEKIMNRWSWKFNNN
jgi:hypothetical protein